MKIYIEWATLLSPIISVIAVIVALIITRRSSIDAKEQIKSIRHLLDVFIAANNLNIKEALRKSQQQLSEINSLIEDAQEELEVDSPFISSVRIDHIEEMQEKNKQRIYLKQLLSKREELESNIALIQYYINKATQK